MAHGWRQIRRSCHRGEGILIKTYQLTVIKQFIEAPKGAAFVAGSAEIYEAVFTFDSYWDGFARTAVFECGGERREQLLVNDRCIVPWEILHAGAYLRVGVYGVSGNATMPTVYSGQMFVARGAEPSEAAREHSPDVFEQIVEIGGQVAEDAQAASNSAEAAAASAQAAQQAAETAAQDAAAETAELVREEMQGYVSDAQNAKNAAQSAQTGAETAKTAAETAQEAAETAKTDAQTAASAAANKAGEAAQSATNAETAAAAAKEAKDAWESMSAEAETLPAGTPATASYEGGVLSLGIPKGDKGDKGDTGETGATGAAGADGADGADGKSAYESAKDGGYTGTETQFNSDLAEVGNKSSVSVSATGTATDEVQYITVDGVEKKLAGGETFIAHYGITTYSEIVAALEQNKFVYLLLSNVDVTAICIPLDKLAINATFVRYTYDSNTLKQITYRVDSEGWTTEEVAVSTGGGAPSWFGITGKPFSTISTDKGLYVDNGALCANVTTVSDMAPSGMHNNDTWLEVI